MMQVIEPQFQRDFISLLPKEVSEAGGPGAWPGLAWPDPPGDPSVTFVIPTAGPVRLVFPGATGPAPCCPDLPLLEGPGRGQSSLEGEVP